jgi:hypothetical protein
MVSSDHAKSLIVARGLDPRAYPPRHPDRVWAPLRVDARHEAAHDEIETGVMR